MLAGMRNRSAQIQAAGEAKQAPVKPMAGTRRVATPIRANISITPARMARLLKPIPWMEKRRMFTRARGKKKAPRVVMYWAV